MYASSQQEMIDARVNSLERFVELVQPASMPLISRDQLAMDALQVEHDLARVCAPNSTLHPPAHAFQPLSSSRRLPAPG